MKELKNYLHLYGKNVPVFVKRDDDDGIYYTSLSIAHIHNSSTEYIKPILRPLKSMTVIEKMELCKLLPMTSENILPKIRSGRMTDAFINIQTPEMVRYLLSKHFDLFNLIPEGLAIDATKDNVDRSVANEEPQSGNAG